MRKLRKTEKIEEKLRKLRENWETWGKTVKIEEKLGKWDGMGWDLTMLLSELGGYHGACFRKELLMELVVKFNTWNATTRKNGNMVS